MAASSARPRHRGGIPSPGIPVGLTVGECSVWVAVSEENALVLLQLGPELGNLERRIPLRGAGGGSTAQEAVVLTVA